MATISKSLTVSEMGSYNLSISLWTATINVQTTSSEFYSQNVTVTSPALAQSETIAFSSAGQATFVAHDPGVYTFSINYAGTEYTTSVEVTDETLYFTTLNRWAATVNIQTTTPEFYGKTITITSSVLGAPATATFSSTGNATYIAGKAGTYTFKVTYGGKDYEKSIEITSQTTYTVKLNTVEIVSWETGTDEQIVDLIAALDDGSVTTAEIGWEVGDTRSVSLNSLSAGTYNVAHAAQTVELVIMEVDSYNGVGHYIVGFKDCLAEKEKMEDSDTNANGWHNSRGRKCCDAIFDMIPSSINSIFKTFSVTSATKGGTNSSGTTDQSGKLALFAEKEIFGTKSYSTSDEFNSSKVHAQLEWFKTAANRVKKVGSSANAWWERSPYYNGSDYFCFVHDGGGAGIGSASNAYGFAPFGVI